MEILGNLYRKLGKWREMRVIRKPRGKIKKNQQVLKVSLDMFTIKFYYCNHI